MAAFETAAKQADEVRNRFISRLGEAERRRLLSASRKVELIAGQILFHRSEPTDHIYFPERGIISMVAVTSDGGQVESGVVGSEGALGLVEAMTCSPMFPTATVQAAGQAWIAPAEICREVFALEPGRTLVQEYAQAMLAEARQSIACQAFHRLEPRLARWLLECRERGELGDELHLTQEFLSIMLGVQRTSVTAALASLEQRGLLRTGRARVRLFDVEGLEAAACECRGLIQAYRKQIGC
ncbi:Crp/Fnr family transcriptional regulator [Phenylobacterium sp.]|uniref:Crp/Fnr family transcriptional regulator n=1 Tax=Phenylobacterium sp. TaxID=1871053 RepID=UPI002E347880|nr:Crp/Fnr family transcriptional regulator [Phenylobacterium sp.]HEX2559968.1 Crp/Fnr family transcriptional regulator [Phenylobacterium sp.]